MQRSVKLTVPCGRRWPHMHMPRCSQTDFRIELSTFPSFSAQTAAWPDVPPNYACWMQSRADARHRGCFSKDHILATIAEHGRHGLPLSRETRLRASFCGRAAGENPRPYDKYFTSAWTPLEGSQDTSADNILLRHSKSSPQRLGPLHSICRSSRDYLGIAVSLNLAATPKYAFAAPAPDVGLISGPIGYDTPASQSRMVPTELQRPMCILYAGLEQTDCE